MSSQLNTSGYCHSCGCVHHLPSKVAINHAVNLMNTLTTERRIDFDLSLEQADQKLSTDYLYGKALGKMFGLMVCKTLQNKTVFLKAFSGQYNGKWIVKGWAPPVFDLNEFHKVNTNSEKEIKKLSQKIDLLSEKSQERAILIRERRDMSRTLMKEIHQLYILNNFHNQPRKMADIWKNARGIPTGTADCCAPKLLHYAANNSLIPVSLAEFYFGKNNLSGSKEHGKFYSSCSEKCYPILGHILCGLV